MSHSHRIYELHEKGALAHVYEVPFYRCDREKDYEIVWGEFAKRFEKGD